MQTPKISIIMPVYDAAKYLDKCLKSVLNQTLKEIEILCVNDGSKDSSLDILREYEKKDSRIKVFTQENSGPARARNVGLKNAKGEYIWFVDADDWCELMAAEVLYENVKEKNADMIIFAARSYDEQKKVFSGTDRFGPNNSNIWLLGMIPTEYNDKLFIFKEAKQWLLGVPMELWNRLFKREFLIKSNIKLHTDLRMGDDCFFNIECYLKNAKIAVLKNILYNYRIGIGSSVVSKLTSSNCIYYDYSLIMATKTNAIIKNSNIEFDTAKYLISRDFDRICAHYNLLKGKNKIKFHIKVHNLLNKEDTFYNQDILKSTKHFELLNKIKNTSLIKYFLKNYIIVKTKNENGITTIYSLFGISIVLKKVEPNRKTVYLFKLEIFKRKITHHEIKKYFLGICYSNKNRFDIANEIQQLKNQIYNLKDYMRLQLSVASLHQQVFPKFKNINNGKDVVVVGAGPTLKYYKYIKNAVHIGVNRTFLYNELNLDYLFLQDYSGLKDYIDDANNYLQDKCIKFYGITTFKNIAIPEEHAIKSKALRYFEGFVTTPFQGDISVMPLPNYKSIIFPALSFAIYTNPKRIYIVGCDCDNLGNFDNFQGESKLDVAIIRNGWINFKQFVEQMYPSMEIISVNPIGLKGIFNDTYTKEYPKNNQEFK
jgi:glycosyltransferase involved in cell wall biosynthesis